MPTPIQDFPDVISRFPSSSNLLNVQPCTIIAPTDFSMIVHDLGFSGVCSKQK